jgi:hypothetical protein
MAVITARNLVLRGVCVTRDVLANVMPKSFSPAYQTEASIQSPRLVHGVRETNPGKRPDIGSDGRTVIGAGRLQRCCARNPRSLAIYARQTILSGWRRSARPEKPGTGPIASGRPALDLGPIAKPPKS